MAASTGIIDGITFTVAFQAALISIINLINKNQANRYLGILVLVFVCSTKYFFIPYLAGSLLPTFLEQLSTSQFYGPVFYLFLLSVIGKTSFRMQAAHLALPFGILVSSPLLLQPGVISPTFYLNGVVLLEYLMILAYFGLCLRLFRGGAFRPVKIKQRYWLFFLIAYGYLLFNFSDLLLHVFRSTFREELMPWWFYLDIALYVISFFFLAVFGLTELNSIRRFIVPASVHFVYEPRQWSANELTRRLMRLFEEERLHVLPELNLQQLAERLGISSAALSEHLSVRLHTSFYQLLNEQRVAEFKRKLQDPTYGHYDLAGLAYAAGFGSKATFNRAFKKLEGMTPREYRRKVTGENS